VECKDGSIYHADHVICTVSLGVLKERHQTLFSPSLPEVKINAIKVSINLFLTENVFLNWFSFFSVFGNRNS
jgi:spermine oxidase